MGELYPGIAGSPITYLAGDISAGQTTIAIGDDTALPDAPNLCTIGFGENIETIRYGAKSNGVLSDVTRGIEGTPRAWPSGTEVARFFTAHDHNAIIHAIKTHLEDNVPHSNIPLAFVSLGAAQSLAQNELTKINFSTVLKDNNNIFDTNNRRFVIKTAGTYLLSGFLNFNTSVAKVEAFIYKNGTLFTLGGIAVISGSTLPFTYTLMLEENDYIEIYARTPLNPSTLNAASNGSRTNVSILRVGD